MVPPSSGEEGFERAPAAATPAGRGPFALFTFAIIVTIATLAAMAASTYRHHAEAGGVLSRELRLEEVVGDIAFLTEALARSVQMAAVTGDPQWAARYRRLEPKLRAAIDEAAALAPAALRFVGIEEMSALGLDLAQLEHRALDLAGRGHLAEARAILSSGDYRGRRQLHEMGIHRLSEASDFEKPWLRLHKLHGIILHLDEALTMSALLGAATGELRWQRRYNSLERQLARAIEEAAVLVPETGKYIAIVDEANESLVRMEREAFALVRRGRGQEAQALLRAPEYEVQKQRYAAGLDGAYGELRHAAAASFDGARLQTITGVSLIACLTTLLFGSWGVTMRAMRRWRRTVVTTQATLEERERELLELNARPDRRVATRTQALVDAVSNAEKAYADRGRQALAAIESRRELEDIIASLSSLLIGLDEDGRPTHWNPAAERILGVSAAHALSRVWTECEIGWEAARVQRRIDAALASTDAGIEEDIPFRRSDGYAGVISLAVESIPPGRGRTRVVLIGDDVTSVRKLETELLHARKLESVGQLAAGIAHEINTPTQYVGDNVRFLRDALDEVSEVAERYGALLAAARQGPVPPDTVASLDAAIARKDIAYLSQEVPKAIDQSLEGVRRIAEIVGAMKEFSHPGSGRKAPLDVNRAIVSTITVSRSEWKYVAEMATELDPQLPPVPCLPNELSQVVLNLLVNAAHAIGDVVGDGAQAKGTITVRTRRVGDAIEIRISDTGPGIPEEYRERVFDPFFTTKAVGKGTGQGLAISRSVVVDKLGGHISFETATGRGTTFIVCLPLEPDTDAEIDAGGTVQMDERPGAATGG